MFSHFGIIQWKIPKYLKMSGIPWEILLMEWQNEIVNENMNMNYGPLNDLRLFRVHHNYHILMHFHIPSLTAIWRHCELDEYIFSATEWLWYFRNRNDLFHMFFIIDSWYYKNISRNESEVIVEDDGREGCFMVRDSSQRGIFTLTILVKGQSG